MGYRFAVVGATGNVGTEMLTILAESDLHVDAVHALASRKSVGRIYGWREHEPHLHADRSLSLIHI